MPKGIPINGINKGWIKKGATAWNKGLVGKDNPQYKQVPWNKGLIEDKCYFYKGGSIKKSGSGNIDYRIIYKNNKRVREHRWIMEKHIGRKLSKDEIIHHKDGDGLNNELSNLVITTRSEHKKLHYGK